MYLFNASLCNHLYDGQVKDIRRMGEATSPCDTELLREIKRVDPPAVPVISVMERIALESVLMNRRLYERNDRGAVDFSL